MLPIIKEFEYSNKGSYRHVNPFSITMVYFSDGSSGCLKGGHKDIKEYMRTIPKFTRFSYVAYHNIYKDGKSRQYIDVHFAGGTYRGYVGMHMRKIEMRKKSEYGENTRFVRNGVRLVVHKSDRSLYSPNSIILEKVVKRPPRCFPKEFLTYCEI